MSFSVDALFEKINSRLSKINPAEREVEHVYKFKVNVDGVEKIYMLDLKAVKFYKGDDAAECTMSCDMATLIDISTGKLGPKEAVEQGKLKIDGDRAFALKLLPYVTTL